MTCYDSSSPWLPWFPRKSFFKCSKMRYWYSNLWKSPYRGRGYPTPPPPLLGRFALSPGAPIIPQTWKQIDTYVHRATKQPLKKLIGFACPLRGSVMYVDDDNTPTPLWQISHNFFQVGKKMWRSQRMRTVILLIKSFTFASSGGCRGHTRPVPPPFWNLFVQLPPPPFCTCAPPPFENLTKKCVGTI